MAISKEDAEKRIKDWADYLDVNTETEEYIGAVETLVVPVMKERLDFDIDKGVFRYKLAKPLELATTKREMVEIRELELDEKRSIEKFKDSEKISIIEAIYGKSAGLTLAESSKIRGRDLTVIATINQVFFS